MDQQPELPAPAPRRRGFLRRHRLLLIAFLSLILVISLVGATFALTLNNSLRSVERISVRLDPATRPALAESAAVNILLLGADAGTARGGAGSSIADDAAKDAWPRGKYRSDTIMIIHIPANRRNVYVVSIPRDSYVDLLDRVGKPRGKAKINAALSLHGPDGAIATVENLTDLRMNHFVMLDWDGFGGITEALGGVTVTIPEDVYDEGELTWPAGEETLRGDRGLDYVRTRYGLDGGDFGRIKRQQNFIRALMIKVIDRGTLTNPFKLRSTLGAVTENLSVDAEFDAGSMRSLAFSLRDIRAPSVQFLTIPTTGTASDPVAGSIVVIDREATTHLITAIKNDAMADHLEANPEMLLGDAASVN